jgi:hypothetical protein
VRGGIFPEAQHTYAMPAAELELFETELGVIPDRVNSD